MKNCMLCVVLHLGLVSYALADTPEYPFRVGEELIFKVRFGWFTIGKAEIKLTAETATTSEPSFHVNIEARTAGLLDLFKHTVNQFDAIISQSELKPSLASQNFLDNRKRDIQTNYFDYEKGKVKVEKINYEKNITHKPKCYDIDSATYDILSAYLRLRSSNLKSIQPGDSIMLKAFFGDKIYDFGMEYAGTESINTIIGSVNALKFYLLFPVSSAFPKPKAVVVWATADKNRLPLKIEAQLKFGRVYCDLVDFKNLKVPITN